MIMGRDPGGDRIFAAEGVDPVRPRSTVVATGKPFGIFG